MNDDLEKIGLRVRAVRKEQGLSQVELARVLGVEETAISKIENGKRGLAAAELAQLCERFGMRSDDLLFGEEGAPSGALLRAGDGAQARRVVERVDRAFADYRYVKALVES
jgi:transcriptional regulator with XRE-family HTH domain